MNMSKVIIYGLFNPITAECFYIGKTVQPLKARLRQHIEDDSVNGVKGQLIKSIINAGKKPIIKELITIDDYYIDGLEANLWQYVEMYFIKHTREVLGESLTNVDKGGNGTNSNNTTIIGNKEVKQYDLYGNYITTHRSIKAAARSIDFDKAEGIGSMISDVCNGKAYTAYKYQWCFVGNEVKILKDASKATIKVLTTPKEYRRSIETSARITINNINTKRKNVQYIISIAMNHLPDVEEQRRLRHNAGVIRYQQTEQGNKKKMEARKRYKKTEKGKEQRRLYNKRVREGKAMIAIHTEAPAM
jgi:DNA polymerase IIIc chi subunit